MCGELVDLSVKWHLQCTRIGSEQKPHASKAPLVTTYKYRPTTKGGQKEPQMMMLTKRSNLDGPPTLDGSTDTCTTSKPQACTAYPTPGNLSVMCTIDMLNNGRVLGTNRPPSTQKQPHIDVFGWRCLSTKKNIHKKRKEEEKNCVPTHAALPSYRQHAREHRMLHVGFDPNS